MQCVRLLRAPLIMETARIPLKRQANQQFPSAQTPVSSGSLATCVPLAVAAADDAPTAVISHWVADANLCALDLLAPALHPR